MRPQEVSSAVSCQSIRPIPYPRSHRLEHHDGTAETFEQARADFEAAWRDYQPGCTEADFTEYRRQRDWTAWKYAMWAAKCRHSYPMDVRGASAALGSASTAKNMFTPAIWKRRDHASS